MLDAIIIDFSKASDLVPHDRLVKKNCSLGRGFKDGHMDYGISDRSFSES